MKEKKPVNPILIAVVSIPHFLFGGFLAAFNWNRMGYSDRAKNVIKWSIIGTIAVIVAALYIPTDTLKKLWSVGIGINLGTGMALRTLQLPEYNKFISRN